MLEQRLMSEIKKDKKYKIAMMFHGLGQFLFSCMTAFFLSNMINAVFIEKESYQAQTVKLFCLFLVILLKALFSFFMQYGFKREAVVLKNKIFLRAIDQLFKKGPILTKEEGSGGIVSSWMEAADKIEPFYGEYLPQFFSLVVTVPLILLVSFFVDGISAGIMLVTGPLLPFFLSLIGLQSKEANKKRLERLTELSDRMLDFLNGIRTLKVFGSVDKYKTILEKNCDDFRIETMKVLKIAFLSAFVLEFAATISTALIAVSLGLRLLYGQIEFYPAFFILLLTPDYYMAIRKFGAKFHMAMGAKAGADKLYMTESESIREEKPSLPLEKHTPIDIQLKNVSFQYENTLHKALSDISITFKSKSITALVGKSGSGKSTLSYLLMQYIKGEGNIDFNLHNLRKYDADSIRELISYIPQKPYIFEDTLKQNILFAKQDATSLELTRAIEKAGLEDFVKRLPEGYDTVLHEVGESISIGEAQRIGFARAFLKDAPIILLDEVTSALDEKNERHMIKVLDELRKEKTVILIAHRLETVKRADWIYVLEDGKMKESGTHRSLLEEKGLYASLVQMWGEMD